jgi:hypothetical protein
MTAAICSVEGCGRPVKAHGLCMNCYMQQRRRGTTERQRAPKGTDGLPHQLNIIIPDEEWARMKAISPFGAVGILARRLLLAEIEKR